MASVNCFKMNASSTVLNNHAKMAIVTPAYNYSKELLRLYQSLEKSEDKDFTWIIVDDGSVDDTFEIAEKIKDAASFKVKYIYQKNGGKCRALNHAFRTCKEYDFYMVIDGDMRVYPTSISKLRKKVDKYMGDERVGAINCWRNILNDENNKRKLVGRPRKDLVISDYDRYNLNKVYGDGIAGYYKRFVERYPHPEFEGENFLGEGTVLQKAAIEGVSYGVVYTDIVIAEDEYRPNGLTAQGRKLRMKNPLGMIYYSGLMQSRLQKNALIRMKYMVSAQAYAYISDADRDKLASNGIDPDYLHKWARVPGMMLGVYWKWRYG